MFNFVYRLSGGAPTLISLPLAANTVCKNGSFVNLESGYLDEAATNDTALVGISLETVTNGATPGVESAKCIIDPDAVYSIVDANARLAGALLDLATDGSAIASSSNTDLIVVAPSTADELTLVMIISTSHYLKAAV